MLFEICTLPLLLITACATQGAKADPPDVVPHVDLGRYLGTWYDVASIPQRFQKGCVAVEANYSLRDDGDIRVVNSCRKETLDGEKRTVEGKAWVVDEATNAKLKVQFFWPFRGDYWIIGLDEDYRWAIVGDPSHKYLWLLSRTRHVEEEIYQGLVQRAANQGYDTSLLVRTLQP